MESMVKISPADITLAALKNGQFQADYPKFYALKKVVENSSYHHQQSVYDHTVSVLEGLLKVFQLDFAKTAEKRSQLEAYLTAKPVAVSRQTLIFLATVFHDVAKGAVLIESAPGQFVAPGHELLAVGVARKYLAKVDLTEAEKEWICRLIEAHGYVHGLIDVKLKRTDQDFFALYRESVGDLDIGLLFFVYADLLGSDLKKADPAMYQARIEAVEDMLSWI